MASSEDRNHITASEGWKRTVFSNNFDCTEKATSTILYFTPFEEIASDDGSYVVSSCHTSEGGKTVNISRARDKFFNGAFPFPNLLTAR